MKAIRIFLLILIIVGLGLLFTQKIWVPKVVNKILEGENTKTSNTQVAARNATTSARLKSTIGKILYLARDTAYVPSSGKEEDILSLYEILSDGSGKKLIHTHDNPVNSNIRWARWVPDGKIEFVAMSGNAPDSSWRLYRINEDGVGLKEIGVAPSESEALETSLRSPELKIKPLSGKKDFYGLYYLHDGKETEIAPLDLSTCKQFCAPEFWNATLTSDKRFVYFSHQDGNIYVVKSDGSDSRKITVGMVQDWKY